MWVHSLAGELRFHQPHGVAKKTKHLTKSFKQQPEWDAAGRGAARSKGCREPGEAGQGRKARGTEAQLREPPLALHTSHRSGNPKAAELWQQAWQQRILNRAQLLTKGIQTTAVKVYLRPFPGIQTTVLYNMCGAEK